MSERDRWRSKDALGGEEPVVCAARSFLWAEKDGGVGNVTRVIGGVGGALSALSTIVGAFESATIVLSAGRDGAVLSGEDI